MHVDGNHAKAHRCQVAAQVPVMYRTNLSGRHAVKPSIAASQDNQPAQRPAKSPSKGNCTTLHRRLAFYYLKQLNISLTALYAPFTTAAGKACSLKGRQSRRTSHYRVITRDCKTI